MRLGTAFVSLIAFVAAATPAAAGGVLVTPPVFADTAGHVVCMVQNLTGEYAGVTGRLRDVDADVVSEGIDVPIPPGVGSAASEPNATGVFYCEFEGLGKGLRGFISLNDGGQSQLVLPTSR
jgi:hypothetical protein